MDTTGKSTQGGVFLATSNSLGVLASQFYLVILPLLILETTENYADLGLLLAIGNAFKLLIPLSAPFQSRYGSRNMMFVSTLTRAVSMALLALLYAGIGSFSSIMIICLALYSLADALFAPTVGAYVGRVYPRDQLQKVNSLIHIFVQVSLIFGPLLVALVLAVLDREFAFKSLLWAAAILTLAYAIIIPFLTNDIERTQTNFIWVRLSLDFSRVFGLVLVCITTLYTNGILFVVFPYIANTVFDANKLGILISSFGVGSLSGALLGAMKFWTRLTISYGVVIAAASIIAVICLYLTTTTDLFSSVLALSLIAGVFVGLGSIMTLSWFQTTTPKDAQASINTVLSFLTVGLSPVAIYFSGVALESIGITGLQDLVAVLVVFYILALPALRKGRKLNA